MPSMKTRHVEPEIMDQPGLDQIQHEHALSGLVRINALSNSTGILWPGIRQLAQELKRPIRVLDVATGAGDVPLRLHRKALEQGITLEIEGCDQSETALAYARARLGKAQAPLRLFRLNVLADDLPDGFDVVCCSLFLHHLSEDEAVSLLGKMRKAARHLVLVNDLRRSRLGWLAAWVGTRLLTRSRVVHFDGPVSVRAAFTVAEAQLLAKRAGMNEAIVRKRWPWRWLLTWHKGDGLV